MKKKFSFEGKDVQETPMVEIAYQILKQSSQRYHFDELSKMIAEIRGLKEDQMLDYLPQLYTEINIDGRFANLGQSEWGLKRWYPADEVDSLYFNRDDDDEEEDEELYDDDDYTVNDKHVEAEDDSESDDEDVDIYDAEESEELEDDEEFDDDEDEEEENEDEEY